jgi:hypothetical protein
MRTQLSALCLGFLAAIGFPFSIRPVERPREIWQWRYLPMPDEEEVPSLGKGDVDNAVWDHDVAAQGVESDGCGDYQSEEPETVTAKQVLFQALNEAASFRDRRESLSNNRSDSPRIPRVLP